MYLSHPVRRIRDNPAEDETVTLRVIATDETAADQLATQVVEFGTAEERLRFAGLLVTLPQQRVEDICALEGIDSIETANTLKMDVEGAGEDVELNPDELGGETAKNLDPGEDRE
jgi:hypothetical protein